MNKIPRFKPRTPNQILQDIVYDKFAEERRKNHMLQTIFWECTLRCNIHCLHCGSSCHEKVTTPDMPLEDFVKVLNSIYKKMPHSKLNFALVGGEPLVRKDLELAGQEIVKRGWSWGIVSNGLAMTEERFKSLTDNGMSGLSFSLDGLEEQHAYLRQNKNIYEKTINAIKMVVKYMETHPDFAFDLITCVHKDNLKDLPALRDLLIDLGVKNWRIFTIFPSGRAVENDLGLNTDQTRYVMNFIVETKKYRKDGKSVNLNFSCEGYLGPYEMRARNYHFFCKGGTEVATILSDGGITGCLSVRAPDFVQGNIYKDDFIDVWNNRFQAARNRESWAKVGHCKDCKKWKKCQGSGLHLHHDAHSEPEVCHYRLIMGK